MPARDLNITLFGMGVWGARIADTLVSIGATLDIVDTEADRERAAVAVGARSFTTESHIASDCHGLVVATPSTSHYRLVRDLAARKLPMFVEKPLTTNLEEARRLGTELDSDGPPVFVMHTWLYHPGIALMGEIAANGELGELLYLRSQRVNWTSPRKDTDSIWTLLPHDLTIARTILGYFPEPRFAVAELHAGAARGLVCVLGESPHVTMEISNRFWQRGREVRMHFTDGTVSLRDEKTPYLEIIHGDARTDYDDARIRKKPFSLDPDPLSRQLTAFLAFLEGGPAPESSLSDGIDVIERITAIRRLAGLPD